MKSDAQRFTELTCSHKKDWPNCDNCPFRFKCKAEMPTYSNPKDILEKMKQFCGIHKFRNFIYQLSDDCCEDTIMFVETYILNPPALLRKAIEFLETNNEKSI
jgi:adenine-specific DNA glycosylase